jgi:hypothetical protein
MGGESPGSNGPSLSLYSPEVAESTAVSDSVTVPFQEAESGREDLGTDHISESPADQHRETRTSHLRFVANKNNAVRLGFTTGTSVSNKIETPPELTRVAVVDRLGLFLEERDPHFERRS